MLIGRDLELRTIGTLLDGLRAQSPFVLAVTGAPGSGRTAVLEQSRRLAADSGATVLAARGARDSGDLAYAGLLTLLRPLERELDDLAGDRADVLRAALAMRRDRVDPIDVRLALLRVLTASAERAPLTMVLDDSDDLDAATVDALRFTFGRLGVDRVGAIVATRDGQSPLVEAATHRVVLGPLSPVDLAAVVESQLDCDAQVASACAQWADGSPLVALELARSLSADERSGKAPLPAVPRASTRIVEQLQGELDALSESARRALVVVAADRSGSVATVNAALAALGEPSIGLDEAEAVGVLTIERDRVAFRHPLLRPLAYHLVAARSRRAAHRALAAALVEPHEAAERAWQLVESCDGPDDDVASLLELVAVDAVNRGALAEAASTFQRAARLSVDAQARRSRLRAAAVAHLDALACDEARRVAEAAVAAGDATAAPLVAEAIERTAGAASALAWLDSVSAAPDERWRRRRQLEVDAARGVAPEAPASVDEVLAAALAAKVNGRLDQARAWCAQAVMRIPPECVALRERAEQLAAECERAAPDPALASLTKAERRVAEAVADGRTNREVADHLFLSVKTVDFHLQGIYRKLGVRSRTELALLLASKGTPA